MQEMRKSMKSEEKGKQDNKKTYQGLTGKENHREAQEEEQRDGGRK